MPKTKAKSKLARKNLKKGKETVTATVNPLETITEGLNEIVTKKTFRYGLAILISSVVLIVIILFALGVKLNFLINDELVLSISPKSYSISATNDEVVSINYTLENNNFLQCNTFCEFDLIDLNNSESSYNYSKILDHKESVTENYEILTPKKGEGQKMYNLKISCNNINTFLCTTNENKKYKTSLITIDYELSGEEKILKKELLNEINNLEEKYYNSTILLNETRNVINILPLLEKNLEEETVNNLYEELITDSEIIDEYKKVFKNENYILLNNLFDHTLYSRLTTINNELKSIKNYSIKTINLQNKNSEFNAKINELKPHLVELVSFYDINKNEFNKDKLDQITKDVDEIKDLHQLIEFLNQTELNQRLNESLEEFSKQVFNFENLINESKKLILEGKTLGLINETNNLNESFCEILDEIKNLNVTNHTEYKNNILNFTLTNCDDGLIYNYNLSDFFNSDFTYEKIELTSFNSSNNSLEILKDNNPVCCYKGACNVCGEQNYTEEKKYPLLFIHGHIFNDANSPESSLDTFVLIQRELEEFGYVNAGELDISEETTRWGRNSNPPSILASYYYISFYDIGAYSIIAQKSERIENYALRLKEIIDAYKRRTGSDKIVIIAHSMGGLVSREYINLFGGESINKLILINTPNHGITPKISKACTILGSKKECEDMSEDSIFLKRLNEEYDFSNTHSIRSIGCQMDEDDGDGVVTNQSAYLENAKNYLIEGECTNALNNDLHYTVLNPELYPETVEIIKTILLE